MLLSAEEKSEFADLLDRVWIAYLISIVGIFIPIIDLSVCSILGGILLAMVLLRLPQEQRELRLAGVLTVVEVIMLVLLSGVTLLSLFSPLFSILGIPIALALAACSLIAYWKIMGKTGSTLAAAGYPDVSRSIYSARIGYIVYTIAVLLLAIVIGVIVGVVVGTQFRGNASAQHWAGSGVACILLPVHWLFGWLFILRPIGWARAALRMN